MREKSDEKVLDRIRNFLRDFLYGAAYLEFEQTPGQEKICPARSFSSLHVRRFLGVPILPPFIPLRLFPMYCPGTRIPGKRDCCGSGI